MWIAILAGERDFSLKENWVHLPVCEELKEKRGVEFGFQIAGKPFNGLEKICRQYPVGLHLPAGIADRWEEEDKEELLTQLSSLDLKFVVVHGIRIGWPFPEYLNLTSDNLVRHVSMASAKDYLEGLDTMEAILNDFTGARIPIALETVAFNNFDFKDGIWQPTMHLDLRVGNYSTDLIEMRERTGCGVVNDIQHLSFSLNFAHWEQNYTFLKHKVLAQIPPDLSKEERIVLEKYHIFLRRNRVPLVIAGTLEEEVEKIGAKIYHLSGCYNSRQVEIRKGRVASHAEIGKDKCFRKLIQMVLSQDPEVLVIEVSGSDDNPCWDYRPPTLELQKRSLENLCELLLEEL